MRAFPGSGAKNAQLSVSDIQVQLDGEQATATLTATLTPPEEKSAADPVATGDPEQSALA